MVGNILCAKTILLILYGRKVYEISVHRQESRNLAVLSQFTSKCMQPSLHNFPNNRCAGSSVYTTDLDSNCFHENTCNTTLFTQRFLVDLPGGHNESFAANAEDPAMGLCLGLSTSLSRHSSRRGSHSLHDQCLDAMANYPSPSGSCCHHRDDVFDPPMVPYPVYPTHSRLHTGARYYTLIKHDFVF